MVAKTTRIAALFHLQDNKTLGQHSHGGFLYISTKPHDQEPYKHLDKDKVDSPHLCCLPNLEQQNLGGEKLIHDEDAPHLDPLLHLNLFSPFSLLIVVVKEILQRGWDAMER